ncbi:MAG: recombinase A, partial [Caldisphaeraceae archaeon]|nr:recombinase A [Caldisphaeraceae archaeon]
VSVGYGIEEFIVDGVIILKARIVKGKVYRYMEIRKMRGNEVKYGEIPFIIGMPEVINIRVPQDVKGLPSGINPRKGFIKIAMGDREVSFARGTQNLFVVDPRIDSLPLISSLILSTVLKERLTIHYRSYLHGEKTIRDYLSKCFEGKEEYAEGLKNFFIRNVNPTSQTIISLELLISSWEELEKPDVIIVEGSGNYIELVSDIESYRQEQYNDLIRRALHNITGFYFIHTKMKKLTSIPLINHYDNVFYITLNKRGDILIKPFKIHLKPVPIDPIVVEREKIESCIME